MDIPMTLTLIATVCLLLSLVLTGLRLANRANTRSTDSGLFWLASLAGVVLSAWALSAALQAQSMHGASNALAALHILTASEARRDLANWKDQPVVLRDVATCLNPAQPVLAARTTLSGEEEVEGEEYDTVRDVTFGTEQEVNKFKLGPDELRVQMEPDGYHVVPAAPPSTTERETSEYSSAINRFLKERQVRAAIPCGATISVTGILREEGPFLTVTPLSPLLSILTDRPWPDIVAETKTQANYAQSTATLLIVVATLAALLQLFLFILWRKGGSSERSASGKPI